MAPLSSLCEPDHWTPTNVTASHHLFLCCTVQVLTESNHSNNNKKKHLAPDISDKKVEIFNNILLQSCLITKISAACCSQLEYNSVQLLYGMVLEVTVKSKKTFVAATNIKLDDNLLDKETWFPLGNCAV